MTTLCGRFWFLAPAVALSLSVFSLAGCGSSTPVQGPKTNSPVVVLVHGTYEGDSYWVNVVADRHTFASELARAIGGDCEIVPFLWRTSVRHEARVDAASQLAAILDGIEYRDRPMLLIAHSHGGNVALEAVGHCHRKIDVAICLATPQIYLQTKSSNGEILRLPVYCKPAARSKIDRLITITAQSDPVVESFASLRTGIDEQTAVLETKDWRDSLGNPRLVDDGDPVVELVEDLLEIKLIDNLIVSHKLNVADDNLTISSEIRGIDAHAAIHSHRFGSVLGEFLRNPKSAESLNWLEGTVIPADAGDGEPLSNEAYVRWWKDHESGFQQSGWLLQRLTVTGTKKTRHATDGLSYWDSVDRSWPDLKVTIHDCRNNAPVWTGIPVFDAERVTWTPHTHLRLSSVYRIEVRDYDAPFGFSEKIESRKLTSDAAQPADGWQSSQLTVQMKWARGHY